MISIASISRPHCIIMYVDAAYCYRLSSVVCRSLTLMSPAKMALPINMVFGLRTLVVPENHVLDGDPDAPCEGASLRRKGRPIVKYRDTLQ